MNLHEINKIEFDSESIERAAMFLLGSQKCYYVNELSEEDNNVLNVLKKYNIDYNITRTPNNRLAIVII